MHKSNVFITGHKGFIARNLISALENRGYSLVVPDVETNICDYDAIKREILKAGLVIHNATVAGTDVCALNPRKAIDINIYGTYNVFDICSKYRIPVIYFSTTNIYDSEFYQDKEIDENSALFPRTLYAQTKSFGEDLLFTSGEKVDGGFINYAIMRPLFCYGGVGDMNSLISKTIYNFIKNVNERKNNKVDIFLDPSKTKDYMYVNNFCDAVCSIVDKRMYYTGIDFNVSQGEPLVTSSIVELLDEIVSKKIGITSVSPSSFIDWHPETDYLGNHIVSNSSICEKTGWSPKISLEEGISFAFDSIYENMNEYNPLMHLNIIRDNSVNFKGFYPDTRSK